MPNNKNVLLATFLSVIVLIAWTWFYEKPRMEKIQIEQQAAELNAKTKEQKQVAENQTTPAGAPNLASSKQVNQEIISLKDRSEILREDTKNRVIIKNNKLHGSIYLKGARFDDLTLAKYFTTTKKDEEVVLLSPANSNKRYFADFGWISSDSTLDLPNPNTLWNSDSTILTTDKPITLSWINKQNVEFIIKISLDENYMFNVTQSVKNNSANSINLAPYGRINKAVDNVGQSMMILHEGPIGVFNDTLQEFSYKKLVKENQASFQSQRQMETANSWLGITDKYWLSSIIPDKSVNYSASFSYNPNNQYLVFNSEFVGSEFVVAKNQELKFDHHFFTGAKEVKLLDAYGQKYQIKLFDRAIDFGWFYFLTKPFFFIIEFLNRFLGNFGLAILAMTVLIKLLLFPIANKSYGAITRIKQLQPKIETIKEKFKDDKLALNREIMALYKKEGVNPASGCLPILIQIPIFFSLYKVLFVTIDMRHAPFYGWIHDLSAPDPTSIFNLFGLLPFDASGFFMIGIWPILMGITMILQQKLSPQMSDPIQAKVMKFLPYILIFVFAAFPAGLLIYWTWSNLLSILQQWFIQNKIHKETGKS